MIYTRLIYWHWASSFIELGKICFKIVCMIFIHFQIQSIWYWNLTRCLYYLPKLIVSINARHWSLIEVSLINSESWRKYTRLFAIRIQSVRVFLWFSVWIVITRASDKLASRRCEWCEKYLSHLSPHIC